MMKWSILKLILLGVLSQAAVQRPSVTKPALLVSAKNVYGYYEVIRLDGYPDDWISYYRRGFSINFTSIVGTDKNITGFRALDFHYQRAIVLWSNPLQGDLEWIPNFTGGKVTISDIHLASSGQVNGIAVDWLSNNVYWVDTGYREILIASMQQIYLAMGQSPYYKRIIVDDLKQPWAIAVHPYKGLLIWTDKEKQTVEVSDLAGANRKVLYQGYGQEMPTSLAIDVRANIVYWVDEGHSAVLSLSLSSPSNVTHLHDYREQFHVKLSGLSLYDKWLFTTGSSSDLDGAIIYAFDRTNVHGNIRMHIRQGPEVVEFFDVAMFAGLEQPLTDGESVCSKTPMNNKCSHICLGYENDQAMQCMCADGYDLQNHGQCTVHRKGLPPTSWPPTSWPTTTTTTKKKNYVNIQSPSDTETDMKSEMNGQTIIIVVSVVMTGLILLVAIISLLLCYLKKRKSTPRSEVAQSPVLATITPDNPAYEGDMPPPYTGAIGNPTPYTGAIGNAMMTEILYENIQYDNIDIMKEKK